MSFENSLILLLFILLPVLVYFYVNKIKKTGITTPLHPRIVETGNSIKDLIYFYLKKGLIIAALILFILALARPQAGFTYKNIKYRGIDIILAIDTSSSMKAEDFKPNRLEAAKDVALKFVNNRPHDRIGLVIFSKDALTLCPLTLDHRVLKNFIKNIKIGLIEDGTAIGMAISEGSLRLSKVKGESRVIILLTDGVNNSGIVDPITAAKAASVINVKIYTIGVGSMGKVPYPIIDPIFGKKYITVDVSLDEDILKKIATITKGSYFRATNSKSLEKVYSEIDKLEKRDIEIKSFTGKRDIYQYFLIIGLFFLIMHLLVNERGIYEV